MNSTGDTYIIIYFSKTYYFYVTLLFADFLFSPTPIFMGDKRKWMASNSNCFTWGALRLLQLFFSFS